MDNFINELANILEVDKKELTLDKKLIELSLWDSLAIVTTVALLDQFFNISATGMQLQQCNTVGDIVDLTKVEIA